MPTVSWIQETALDRYHEAKAGSTRVRVPRILFRCTWCGKRFQTHEQLCRHTSRKHPLALPRLHIRGEPLPPESDIRTRLEAGDLHLVQCTHCEVQVDGGGCRTFSPEDFLHHLVHCSAGIWNVRLVNEQGPAGLVASEQYRIRFNIPDPAMLEEVDDLFKRILLVEELQHADLARFQAALPEDAPVRDYGSALGDYAIGILLKEGRSPPLSPREVGDATAMMQAALATLRYFQRPVAQAVCGAARFNVNDFHHETGRTAAEIEAGFRFFQNLIGVGPETVQPSTGNGATGEIVRSAICPIDVVSHKLLAACEQAIQGTLSREQTEHLEQLAAANSLNEYDIPKVHALCAYSYLNLNLPDRARRHLQAIRFNPWLQAWAQRQLDEYLPDEN